MRKANLYFLTNNMRFLILPGVKVPHLASHILGRVARRISSDRIKRYQHPIYLLETFVEKERFRGTCYQAANWIYVGESKGRSRNDRYRSLKVPIKDLPAVYGTSHQKTIKFLNLMRMLLTNSESR